MKLDLSKIKEKKNVGIEIYLPIVRKQKFDYWDISYLLYVSNNFIAFYEQEMGLLSIVPICKINAYRLIYKD